MANPTASPLTALGLKISEPIQVEGIPTPQQMMRVVEGTPFIVPAGKRFVVTGLGSTTTNTDIRITISFNTTPVWHWMVKEADVQATPLVPTGLVAAEGETVEVVDNHVSGQAVVLGYLADV